MATSQQSNIADTMASVSPAPTPSIERDESEDAPSENDDDAVADGTAKENKLTTKEHEIIKNFVDSLASLKDEEYVSCHLDSFACY